MRTGNTFGTRLPRFVAVTLGGAVPRVFPVIAGGAPDYPPTVQDPDTDINEGGDSTVIVQVPNPQPPREIPNPPPSEEAMAGETRLRECERRIADLEGALAEMRLNIEGRALAEHPHPLPGELAALNEHLSAIVSEETEPSRQGVLHKRLF